MSLLLVEQRKQDTDIVRAVLAIGAEFMIGGEWKPDRQSRVPVKTGSGPRGMAIEMR